MVNLDPRRLLLLLALQPALIGCATDEPEADQLDVDGEGKGDAAVSSDPNRLLDIPFYFSMPKSVVTTTLNRSGYPYPTVWNSSLQSTDIGLRVIAIQQGATLESKRQARRDMATKLARAGVLQDGDLVLTFRPELQGTMAYPHIQMGTTHAGLIYTDGGVAYNIDSPLDSEYVGQFDTSHYAGNGGTDAGTDALHIVRPHGMTDTRRAQLRTWVGTLKRNLSRINGARQQIKFQSDYLTPDYVSAGKTTRQTITTLGKIILEADTTTKQPMFCSEFAWHMLALSNCTADQIKNAPDEGAACVDEIFAPMPLVASSAQEVGLADGPLITLMALPEPIRALNLPKIFATGDAARLSSGHRMVSEQVAPLMGPLSQFYGARVMGAPVEATAPVAMQLSAQMPLNYSPTAFLVQAMAAEPVRSVDYIATLAFVSATGYQKAQRLSSNPVP
jgi:hypothetical protein